MRHLTPGWKLPFFAPFAERLRELRMAAGLSRAELGRRAGLTRGNVSKLERGLQVPRRPTLERLAQGLGVSVEELVATPSEPLL